MIYMHWIPTRPTVNKEYYVEVLREFRKRFLGKSPVLFKSGQWHFHQDNAPVDYSIPVTDYLTKMDIKTVHCPLYSPDRAPCDFWLFPKLKKKLRGCRYETLIEEMKEAVPVQKKSGNLLNAPCRNYIKMLRARGVMDTVTRVQFLDETDCVSHSTNTLGKGMNPIILPPAKGK